MFHRLEIMPFVDAKFQKRRTGTNPGAYFGNNASILLHRSVDFLRTAQVGTPLTNADDSTSQLHKVVGFLKSGITRPFPPTLLGYFHLVVQVESFQLDFLEKDLPGQAVDLR
jgi:hypothetical protein